MRIDLPFPAEGDDGPVIALLVLFYIDVSRERDGTHDTISKFLIENCFVGESIVLDDLE